MTSADLRQKYFKFFEERGHKVIPSTSLVPENDPTTLFISAGMQPLIPYLLGQSHPEGKRLVDAQKWVDQALSRNMYLEDRDIEKTMDIYFTGWKKGLKSTYYLHMKPRHTAEQSTVAVNKSAKLGKFGFASVFRKVEETPIQIVEQKMEILVETVKEEIIEKEQEQIIDSSFAKASEDKQKPLIIPTETISHQIFSKVQTQLPPMSNDLPVQNLDNNLSDAYSDAHEEFHEHFQTKIIEGKVYKIHMPSDPQENFTCDGCQ